MDVLLGIVIGSVLSKKVHSPQQSGGTAQKSDMTIPCTLSKLHQTGPDQSIRQSKRCPYYMKHRGRQCKNHVVYGYYCYVHNKYRKGLRIKNSTIKNAGRGLYAAKQYKLGQIVSQYQGQKLKKRDVDKKYKEQGDFTVCNGNKPHSICVDAAVTSSSNGRYANTQNTQNNTELKYKNTSKTFRLVATEPIQPQQEIFADYGQSYHLITKPQN